MRDVEVVGGHLTAHEQVVLNAGERCAPGELSHCHVGWQISQLERTLRVGIQDDLMGVGLLDQRRDELRHISVDAADEAMGKITSVNADSHTYSYPRRMSRKRELKRRPVGASTSSGR